MVETYNKPMPVLGKVLIIVENLPVPFDRRVWQEATALRQAGYEVSVICPTGKKHTLLEETLDGIHIYRHNLPLEASGALGYLVEYSAALFHEMRLSLKVLRRHGFDAIHACNPPDLIFLVALFYKLFFGKKFIFDQHDINPELYEVKFGKKGFFHKLLTFFERCTFKLADGSLATNETLKGRAIETGKMPPDKVWVVRSFPDIERFKRTTPDESAKRGRRYLAGYVGIMAEQDGVEYLVRAMDHIVNGQGRDDIGCVIIGDGPDYDRLRALAAELNLLDHVEFTGYLSGAPLLEKLSACDIGVIPDPPNVCNDKLSMNKVFEYMALGMPFVQFELEQAKIDAGEAAHVVPEKTPESLAQGMIDLLGDPERRTTMATYASHRAQREFHWDLEKHSLLDAYRTLLQPKEAAKITESVSVSQ
ncbi:glycosyltransferase family 4 protein [Roseibium album]|uniref:Glycosyltransferase KanE n=1 Tax=Roseibium album TaxID=311410 RepID=A0A0M7AM05_9HYPH|nr:glycosyltransferase family 4 protein [Roseibium album]MBG6146995.1 glycosyltransferase involved in cell wall biosynthesis [Labrenzia sp. EL_142]MBG6160811.1 glycosyltransferase involved in cell wall biosynthesis [Labrenzia sp. EL_195]CTQ60214.1 Glycosyltransferase KanE [Roseibium album]CTQ66888.1 Glycosyltransferase KanE [Roseibium album]CTQ74634.1 Glycosyltransferase KanE [Roseibium album]